MITEIFLEGNPVDINADISSLLTFAIDDVKDFSSRQTAFSKTIVIPGTTRNNRLFGGIFEIGIANEYDSTLDNIGYNFNAAKAAKCLIFQDNLQTFKGTLRLLEIDKDKGNIEYEVALNGELTSLNVALSSGFLTDLDFSAYNQLWTAANIVASWDNPGGSGIYYPLIDYGNYSVNKHDWDFRTFRPALYVKEYIDKMFEAANFRYECALFNTTRFKKLVIPHNQKQLVKLASEILKATSNTQQHIISRDDLGLNKVYFPSVIGGFFTTTDNKTFTYTGTDTLNTSLEISFSGYYNMDAQIPPSSTEYYIEIFIRKNLTEYYHDPINLTDNIGLDTPFSRNYNIPITLNQNDTFEVTFRLQGGPAGPADAYINTASLSITSSTAVFTPIDYNDTIDIAFAIPKNIRQVDFLVSIVKLFNLYVYEDRFDERKIHISPFIDFYSGDSTNSVDWTYKLNRDKPIKIKPLSEINSKIYKYNYKDDSDYFNETYKKRYNQSYGSYTYDTEFEFVSQTNSLELIFASTPLVGYIGEEKIYPTIFKRNGTTTIVEEQVDSVIRIMQTKKVMGVNGWQIKNGATVLGTYNYYGYAGHFDDPDNPDNDLNFGVLNELFFVLATGDLTKTQFNVYWSSYMAEITDKDSKMLTAKFYLTAKDIFELDFSKYVFLDGVLFRLNKIIDYNASIPSDCTVELLKVINTTYSYTIIPPPDNYIWAADDGECYVDSDNSKIYADG